MVIKKKMNRLKQISIISSKKNVQLELFDSGVIGVNGSVMDDRPRPRRVDDNR